MQLNDVSGNGTTTAVQQRQQGPSSTTTTTTINPTTDTTTRSEESGRHPASYMEVLEMLERGETPPGIRDDINDKPPNPEQPPPPARMKPLPKPWEQRDIGVGIDATTPVAHNLIGNSSLENGGGDDGTNENTNNNDNNSGGGGAIDLSPVVPDDALQRPASSGVSVPSPLSTTTDQRRNTTTNISSPLTTANKGATSIFEAATSSQGSPGVIAGRLSPSSDQQGRGKGVGVATPTSLFSETNGKESNQHVPRPPRLTTATPLFPDEGGLGRPTSRGWRPPPIPVPTLSLVENDSTNNSSAALGPGRSGSAASGSQNSLGADFAAA
jgi:hypothetical protein